MRTLSRQLPSPKVEVGSMPLLGKAILLVMLALIGYWAYASPFKATIGLGTIIILVTGSMIIEGRRIARIRQQRNDTICDFRRSFDVREIDPWIIRATHEAFSAWFDTKLVQFPLRASDSIEDDLKIDWEDVDNLAHEVAQRAGYDMANCEANPLYGKVKTVEDFVLFFTHQPKTREAEQGA